METSRYTSFYELYMILEQYEEYELGGEYNPLLGFIIDKKTSRYDTESSRPYTVLNMNSKYRIVWHSHPFDYVHNRYPSIEDSNVARLNSHMIFLLITQDGIYTMSALKQRGNREDITELYKIMHNGDIETNFKSNICMTAEYMKRYGLYCCYTPIKQIPPEDCVKIINHNIKKCKSYKLKYKE